MFAGHAVGGQGVDDRRTVTLHRGCRLGAGDVYGETVVVGYAGLDQEPGDGGWGHPVAGVQVDRCTGRGQALGRVPQEAQRSVSWAELRQLVTVRESGSMIITARRPPMPLTTWLTNFS
jgi:hypothetical protein